MTQLFTSEQALAVLNGADRHAINRMLTQMCRAQWWPKGDSPDDTELVERLRAFQGDKVWLYTPLHDVGDDPDENRCCRFFAEFFLYVRADTSQTPEAEADYQLCKSFGWSKWDFRSKWEIREQATLTDDGYKRMEEAEEAYERYDLRARETGGPGRP